MPDNSHENDRTKSYVAITSGTVISHYTVTKKIGTGGMGEVYLAKDTELKRQVALKFLPHHMVTDQNTREWLGHFERQAVRRSY